jgi:hypothetical protein
MPSPILVVADRSITSFGRRVRLCLFDEALVGSVGRVDILLAWFGSGDGGDEPRFGRSRSIEAA